MDAAKIADLKQFVDHCKSNPSILHDPSLTFFRTYLHSLGARIPPQTKSEKGDIDMSNSNEDFNDQRSSEEGDNIIESDIELDDSDIVEPDNDPLQKMGNPAIEVTEEKQDAAQTEKVKAMEAISEGKLGDAIVHLTEAITLNPTSAILYATRASVFVKLKKPNAAICDANAALEINPDSAKGYKVRGIARAMLGQWEEAASDLHVASKLDYDEEIALVLKKVEPNARKIQEHRRKYERLRKERELKKAERERQQRVEAQGREALSALKEGQVIGIHSASELETKLNAASRTSRLAILYFTATWCGPCRYVSPLFTNLATKYPKTVFLKVDIDDARDVAAKWNISSVPTFFFIKNGKEIDKVVGADKNGLERKIEQYAS
ncbi:hypothetical protein P3X46_022391 [Hevea brasiliensis]|uniref:Thioredoxin domain-containing protein n=1 Tax=Hevea brasiliensis TaxID=3981 RepID=A0ABQ9L9C1_HEVBR|nr:TPR repeat-containing thioredoxin TDX [Hevea brasiliensis]KAJ9162632.1 hypothetical protein P3X46_022391 [Hevea brasiliensis]